MQSILTIAPEAPLSRRRFLTSSAAAALLTTAVAVPLTGCPSTDDVSKAIDTAIQDIDPAVGIVTTIASIALAATGNGILSPVVIGAINSAVPLAKASLATLSQLLRDYKNNRSQSILTQIDDAVQDVQQHLGTILSSIPGNPVPQNIALIINTGLSTLVTILSTIQALIPPSTKSLSAHPYRAVAGSVLVKPAKIELPNADQIRLGFNSVLVLNGYMQYQLK